MASDIVDIIVEIFKLIVQIYRHRRKIKAFFFGHIYLFKKMATLISFIMGIIYLIKYYKKRKYMPKTWKELRNYSFKEIKEQKLIKIIDFLEKESDDWLDSKQKNDIAEKCLKREYFKVLLYLFEKKLIEFDFFSKNCESFKCFEIIYENFTKNSFKEVKSTDIVYILKEEEANFMKYCSENLNFLNFLIDKKVVEKSDPLIRKLLSKGLILDEQTFLELVEINFDLCELNEKNGGNMSTLSEKIFSISSSDDD
eukprot:TRINITY_DN565_c0_g1_i1.p1 TRINITY_DN565_c0_g1~~TRINITY_DN565_c0_g1_i1.p1  ORF type:complete len:254 (+),score=69.90 TRINITY_DN565_c0_g1_i1:55-816(+)